MIAYVGESSNEQQEQEQEAIVPSTNNDSNYNSKKVATTTSTMGKNNRSSNRYTILEAAFHDPSPAYQVATVSESIELRAKSKLLGSTTKVVVDDNASIHSMTPSLASTIDPCYDAVEEAVLNDMKSAKYQKAKLSKMNKRWNCCGKNNKNQENDVMMNKDDDDDSIVNTIITLTPDEMQKGKQKAQSKYEKEVKSKKQRVGNLLKRREKAHTQAEKERRKRFESKRWTGLPEGVLVYRLNSSDKSIALVSPTNSETDSSKVLRQMIVCYAGASGDPSRRGIDLVGLNGEKHTLIACDQHTAITWLEALYYLTQLSSTSSWYAGQEEYLNLARYSHQLVHQTQNNNDRSDGKSKSTTAVFYNIQVQHHQPPSSIEQNNSDGTNGVSEEERLEAIAKRRAIVKDSWDFYRMICSLLRDRRKYEEAFTKLCIDPVYPYLQSLSGLNDQGPKGIFQKYLSKYRNMSRTDIVSDQIAQANIALPSLVEICKALAGSLGMEEVGVGPIKESSAALRKADKKYTGDVLKITDYCRALLVVKDLPTLLAVLELARDSFGPLIRRVKLSSLQNSPDAALAGGYRDAKINVELKDHICEIQIHLWDMYAICGVDGYRHYRHSLEYSTDSFHDPYQALQGLETQVVAEMIVLAEETVSDVPLFNLQWFQEKFILDYFAEVGLFLSHKLFIWAEVTLNHLIQLRIDSPTIGIHHHETRQLQQYLVLTLQGQNKNDQAQEIRNSIHNKSITESTTTKDTQTTTRWQSFLEKPMDLALEMCSLDPNKKQRHEEEEFQSTIRTSKTYWKIQRDERFHFLVDNASDDDNDHTTLMDGSFSVVSSTTME